MCLFSSKWLQVVMYWVSQRQYACRAACSLIQTNMQNGDTSKVKISSKQIQMPKLFTTSKWVSYKLDGIDLGFYFENCLSGILTSKSRHSNDYSRTTLSAALHTAAMSYYQEGLSIIYVILAYYVHVALLPLFQYKNIYKCWRILACLPNDWRDFQLLISRIKTGIWGM